MDANQVTATAKGLSTGNKILGGSAVAALVAANMTWYKYDTAFFDGGGIAGRRFTFGWMGLLLLLGAAGVILAPAFGAKKVETGTLKTEQIGLVAAGLGTALWLIRLVSVPGFGGFQRGLGLYLAIAAAAGVVYGVVTSMKEKGIALPTSADLKSATTTTATAAPVAPAQQYPAPQHPAPQHPAPQHPAPQAAPQAAAPQFPAPQPAVRQPTPGPVTEF